MSNENENIGKSISQKRQIKAWLESGKSITAFEALEMFGCMRLAARVCDLRDEGMQIEVRGIVTPSGKHVTQYRMKR